jgi:hypothetical protein
VEFDALVLAGVPGADDYGARDAKAGNGTGDAAGTDPRVLGCSEHRVWDRFRVPGQA